MLVAQCYVATFGTCINTYVASRINYYKVYAPFLDPYLGMPLALNAIFNCIGIPNQPATRALNLGTPCGCLVRGVVAFC